MIHVPQIQYLLWYESVVINIYCYNVNSHKFIRNKQLNEKCWTCTMKHSFRNQLGQIGLIIFFLNIIEWPFTLRTKSSVGSTDVLKQPSIILLVAGVALSGKFVLFIKFGQRTYNVWFKSIYAFYLPITYIEERGDTTLTNPCTWELSVKSLFHKEWIA